MVAQAAVVSLTATAVSGRHAALLASVLLSAHVGYALYSGRNDFDETSLDESFVGGTHHLVPVTVPESMRSPAALQRVIISNYSSGNVVLAEYSAMRRILIFFRICPDSYPRKVVRSRDLTTNGEYVPLRTGTHNLPAPFD